MAHQTADVQGARSGDESRRKDILTRMIDGRQGGCRLATLKMAAPRVAWQVGAREEVAGLALLATIAVERYMSVDPTSGHSDGVGSVDCFA